MDAWIELKEHFLIQTNQTNDKNLGEYAMIDHESPSHQLHLSYDIEDIKQVRIGLFFKYLRNSLQILC